jgi:ribosomal protein L18
MKKYLYSLTFVFAAVAFFASASPAAAEETHIRPDIEYGAATVHRIQVDISWRDPYVQEVEDRGGVDYYSVRYGTKQHLPKPKKMTVDGSEDAFVISGLKSGSHYYIDVVAHYNNGDYSWVVGSSNNARVRDTSLDDRLYTKQRRPRFLKVKDKQPRQATLKWSKKMNSADKTRFRVKVYQKKKNKKGYKKVHDEFVYESNVYKITAYDLKPDTKYYFKVKGRIFNYEWTKYSDRKYFRTPPAE